MQLVDFLAAVLPPPNHGFYCAVELSTKRKEHRFVETIEDLANAANEFAADDKDTYFAVSTFSEGTNRLATNSAYTKSLFADIDCGPGKAYEDVGSALEALDKWLANTGFPYPYVVESGGGIHCYFPFVECVAKGTWQVLAERFKRACVQHGFAIDYSVSADAARVLRVPGSFNHKYDPPAEVRIRSQGKAYDPPAEVRIRSQGKAYESEHYARLLEPYGESKALVAVAHNFDSLLDAAPTYAHKKTYDTELAEQTKHSFKRIYELGGKGCKQIGQYIKHAADDGMEPLWRGVISIAKYCYDGEEFIGPLSELHPYDTDRQQRKLAEIKGPYNCATFDRTVPAVCSACKHFGKITNPIVLGKELAESETTFKVKVEDAPTTETATHTVIADTTTEIQFPYPPKGFRLSRNGVTYMVSNSEGVSRAQPISDTPFYAAGTYDRDGERYVSFTIVEHERVRSIVMALAVATSRDDGIKNFAKAGVMVPSGGDNGFRLYLKATIAEAKKNPPQIMPTSLGWQADDTFAFDQRVFSTHGETNVPMYGFDNIAATTGVRGSLDTWRMIIGSIARLERWDLVSMMLIGFASPLMKFTGLNGLTFHLCGNDSGKGKTLAQRLASSVWGVPDKFRVTPNTSPIAMVNRLGMLGNLPLLVDEITHKGRADSEWFPEFLSQMSDGRGKDRMESQTNSERRNTTTWASLALMTSNKHMLDYLTAERTHGSEGEVRRLIEIVFDKELVLDEQTKSLLYDALPENYGVAGEAYARWMVRNVDTVKELTQRTYREVFLNFEATGDERFWLAGCACILAATRLIGQDYADIVELPFGKIAQFLYNSLKHMRVETRRMKRGAMDILNEFTKRHFGKLVMVNGSVARIAGIEVAETMDRQDLCGRVEKGFNPGWVSYFIEERALKAFCSSLSYGYAEFKADLKKEGIMATYGRKDLLSGTKGPSMPVRSIHLRQRLEDSEIDLLINKTAANS